MKNKLKNFTMTLLFAVLVFASVFGSSVRTEAKSTDGVYNFTPCRVTKFQIKDGTLTLKVDKADIEGITKNNDTEYKSYKLKVKVAKNCKYITEYYQRGKGTLVEKNTIDYKEIKDIINRERTDYNQYGYSNNVVYSYLKVKNNKVVKIAYCAM